MTMPMSDAFNAPTGTAPSWATGAPLWALRLSQTPYKSFIRELAGLGDDTLAALAAQVRAQPHLRMPRAWRFALGGTIGLTIAGAGMLAAGIDARRNNVADQAELLLLSGAGALILGLVTAIVCWLLYLRRAPAIRSYKDLALHVGVIDEQHPWLYETCETTRQADANAYRVKILGTRGPLRGVDLPMMRLVIAAQAEVLRCRTASEAMLALQTDTSRALPQPPTVDSSAAPMAAMAAIADQGDPDESPTYLALPVDPGPAWNEHSADAAEGGTLLRFPHAEGGVTPTAVGQS